MKSHNMYLRYTNMQSSAGRERNWGDRDMYSVRGLRVVPLCMKATEYIALHLYNSNAYTRLTFKNR